MFHLKMLLVIAASLMGMVSAVSANQELRDQAYYETVAELYERGHPTARLIVALYAGKGEMFQRGDYRERFEAMGYNIPVPDLERVMPTAGGFVGFVFARDIENGEMVDRLRYPEVYTYARLVDYQYRERAQSRKPKESMEDIVSFWSEHVVKGQWRYEFQDKNRVFVRQNLEHSRDMAKSQAEIDVGLEAIERFANNPELHEQWREEELARRLGEIDRKFDSPEMRQPNLHDKTEMMKAWVDRFWDLDSNLAVLNSDDYRRCKGKPHCYAFIDQPLPPLVLH